MPGKKEIDIKLNVIMEIRFKTKPTESIRKRLSNLGFGWHGKSCCWKKDVKNFQEVKAVLKDHYDRAKSAKLGCISLGGLTG